MRATPGRLAALALAALLAAAGCSGLLSRPPPEKQRFHLTLERDETPESGSCACSVRVERVRVARTYERKRFVYRTGDAIFEEDFYHEFYAPPGELVQQATGEWLAESGLFAKVLGASEGSLPDWLLEGRVRKLYADLRAGGEPQAVMEIEFMLLDARRRRAEPAFARRYGATIRALARTPEAIHAAWSASLERILASLEADLREEPALLVGAR